MTRSTAAFLAGTAMAAVAAFGAEEKISPATNPLPAASAPRFTHDWPMYVGPDGTFADRSKVPILNDLSRARLVWKSEDKSIGWGKSTSHEGMLTKRAPGLYASGQGSLIVAGGLVIAAYYIPSGDVLAKTADNVEPPYRQRALISADDVILAVDAATGKTVWKQVFAGKGLNRSHSKRPAYGLTPAAAEGRVFHLGTTARLYAVDLATGKPLWESDCGDRHKALEALKVRLLRERLDSHNGNFGEPTMITSLVVHDKVLLVPAGTKLMGFDTATGAKLWEVADALSGDNVPCPTSVEGQSALFCFNGQGDMRLIRPKTGEVLWTLTTKPRLRHTTQPVAADGKAFVFHPLASASTNAAAGSVEMGRPACYALKPDGAKLLWDLPDEFAHPMRYDGGPAAKIGYRDGVAYFGGLANPACLVAIQAEDGKVVNRLSPAGWGQFHLWGDKLILIGDNSHESMGMGCSYAPYTLNLAPTGPSYSPRGRSGVSGYILPIRDPFADGYQFTRAATGEIWCYDIRANP